MGRLIDGVWHDADSFPTPGGRFQREESSFRDWVSADGASGFKAEPGRYHLYVSLACPWAHRTLIARAILGLEETVSVSVVDPRMAAGGWRFGDYPGSSLDTVNGAEFLHQVYTRARTDYTGRVTVPALWDRETGTVVNNESAEIVRMFNGAFRAIGARGPDLYPPDHREAIDAVNGPIYAHVNNGVYRSGFAPSQEAYDEAVTALFATLDDLEERLEDRPFLTDGAATEADWRLFPTLVRFDPVYHGHFKCNLRRLVDYPRLWDLTRRLYGTPGVAETVNMDHIKTHYYASHRSINPTGIVARGPIVDVTTVGSLPA